MSRTNLVIGFLLAVAVIVAVIAIIRFDPSRVSGLGGAFQYDLDEFRHVDPELIRYDEISSFDTGYAEARAICTSTNGEILVGGDRSVSIFTLDGERTKSIPLDSAVTGVAIDGDTIYAGVGDHVEVVSVSGEKLMSWQRAHERSILTSIAVSGDNVFVADAGTRVVYRYDRNGRLINEIGRKDESRNVPGFVIPSPFFDLTVSGDGLLRVANPGRHRIEAYTFDGDLEIWWGEYSPGIEGFCGCCNPVNFAILPDGRFVTTEKGIARVKTYSSDGDFLSVVAPPALFDNPTHSRENAPTATGLALDVAVTNDGLILVLDPHGGKVRIFAERDE